MAQYWNEFDAAARIEWAAADTEAYTLIDGKRVTTQELDALGREKPQAWFREHVSVDVYAWLISDGRRSACFRTFDEFAAFCASARISTVWWYNAKYDFAHIDYSILTGGWTLRNEGKLRHKEYRSIHSAQGQRYSLTLALEYRNAQRHTHVHQTKHYDLCNLFGGGLAKNLAAFKVTDYDGNPVRKLDLDYQGDNDTAEARAYMVNDVHGLYHLTRIASDFLSARWGYTLTGKKPDVMTAGGLAKRVLLSYYNGFSSDHNANVKAFKQWHKMSVDADTYLRANHLYRGGITNINPRYRNVPLHGQIYKYDINSMYPYQMATMPDLVGTPNYFKRLEDFEAWPRRDDFVAVYVVTQARGVLRKGFVPMWYDVIAKEYTRTIDVRDGDLPLMFFADEWSELNEWYDIDATISGVFAYRKAPAHAFKRFILDNYELKREGKATGNKVQEAFAKLLLNSSYGKLAENPNKQMTHREVCEETGAVRLIDDGMKIDDDCILSVVLGALITSMARTQLMRLIREVCPVPERDFIYCDTDSIASFTQYANPDPYTLGALKDETVIDGVQVPYTFGKYLAPKTYVLARDVNGKRDIEAHTKGLPVKAIFRAGGLSSDASDDEIDAVFAAGRQFVALAAMNVRGGKALVPVLKHLCRPDNTIIHGDAADEFSQELTLMEE